MFVRYFIEIHAPYADVEVALLRGPADWIPSLLRETDAFATDLLSEVGFSVGGRRVSREVVVNLGRAARTEASAILPIRWQSSHEAGLFPVMEADLEVAMLGPERTQLAFNGRYEPPLGMVGRLADRTLLHRVAEATARDFLERVAGRLHAALAAAGHDVETGPVTRARAAGAG